VANSRDPLTPADLTAETGATAVWAADAATDADVVIVSIPQKNVPDLAAGIVAKAKPGAPVIETNNYYPRQRDGRIDAIEDGTPESAWVADQLGSPFIKIFNGIFWKHLLERGEPAGTPGRIALPVAAANGPAKDLASTWSTGSASTPWTPARLTSHGASSPGPRLRQELRRGENPHRPGRGLTRAARRVPRLLIDPCAARPPGPAQRT
jgi:hypothetical protein